MAPLLLAAGCMTLPNVAGWLAERHSAANQECVYIQLLAISCTLALVSWLSFTAVYAQTLSHRTHKQNISLYQSAARQLALQLLQAPTL
jgi:hypothetical protein